MGQYGKIIIYMMHDYPFVYEFLGNAAGSLLKVRAHGAKNTEELIGDCLQRFCPVEAAGLVD